MSKVLVVGASGQLGSCVVDHLAKNGVDCVVFLRRSSRFDLNNLDQIKAVYGDLSEIDSLYAACEGVTHVIATASSIVPRGGDHFGNDEIDHYRNLILACKHNRVSHFIYVSAFSSDYDHLIPEFRIKREIENIIVASGVPYTIFRVAPFMDIYYAVMGSGLAIKGVMYPTLLRGFWLTNLYSRLTSGILEKYGIALLPGNGQAYHSFISIEDVANFTVKAVVLPASMHRIIEIGGPEAVSWRDVANIYGAVIGKKITTINVPSFILYVVKIFFHSLSPAGENIMSILYLLSKFNFPIKMDVVSKEFDVSLVDTRSFVENKFNAR